MCLCILYKAQGCSSICVLSTPVHCEHFYNPVLNHYCNYYLCFIISILYCQVEMTLHVYKINFVSGFPCFKREQNFNFLLCSFCFHHQVAPVLNMYARSVMYWGHVLPYRRENAHRAYPILLSFILFMSKHQLHYNLPFNW